MLLADPVLCQVEVEVIHNAYDDEKENASSVFRGRNGAAMQLARACLYYLRQAPQHFHRDIEKVGDGINQNVSAAAEQVPDIVLIGAGSGVGEGENGDSKNEEWASDKDEEVVGTGSRCDSTHSTLSPVPISTPARGPHKHEVAKSGKKGRRPASAGEGGLLPSGYPRRPRTAPDAGWSEDGEERVRGRRGGQSSRPDTANSARGSVKHRRLELLRTDTGSRDASPTRSVRFADPNSPRSPLPSD